MALFSTLADLKDAVRDECERRNHARFDAALPRFVAGAEQRMWYGADAPFPSEPLRLNAMEERQTIAVTDGTGSMPGNYLVGRRLMYNEDAQRPHHPVRYIIEGDSIRLDPEITTALDLVYFGTPDPLEDETDSNGVLEQFPMLYFHAALIEAYRWLRNTDKSQEAFGNYTSLCSGLLRTQRRARHVGPLAMPVPNTRRIERGVAEALPGAGVQLNFSDPANSGHLMTTGFL